MPSQSGETSDSGEIVTLEPRPDSLTSQRRKLTIWVKRLTHNKYIIMFTLPIFGLIIMWCHYVEPNRIILRNEVIYASEFCKGIVVKKRIRILHLSDFHLGTKASILRLQESIERGLKQNPDLVFITGDISIPSNPDLQEVVMSYLSYMAHAIPTFACLGNHDYYKESRVPIKDVIDMYKHCGVWLMKDEARGFIINGNSIYISGLTDFVYGAYRPDSCMKRLGYYDERPVKPLTFVLSHNADSMYSLKIYNWDVMFSGHTHAGQFRVPFTHYCPAAPVKHKQYADRGLYRLENNRFLNVSAGIGNYLELRLNCYPEITIVDILPD
ncbi:MAG: metallophosphoesterase [Victivallales bacterium]|nr:metallophosphoesterase [Victivallales bacterium]